MPSKIESFLCRYRYLGLEATTTLHQGRKAHLQNNLQWKKKRRKRTKSEVRTQNLLPHPRPPSLLAIADPRVKPHYIPFSLRQQHSPQRRSSIPQFSCCSKEMTERDIQTWYINSLRPLAVGDLVNRTLVIHAALVVSRLVLWLGNAALFSR